MGVWEYGCMGEIEFFLPHTHTPIPPYKNRAAALEINFILTANHPWKRFTKAMRRTVGMGITKIPRS